MSTYAELKTKVAEALSDPSNGTFTPSAIAAIIQEGFAEVGRIAPERFHEDVILVANQMSYQLRSSAAPLSLTTPFGVAATNVLTSTAHGLVAGTAVKFLTLTGGAGLATGAVYFVIATGLTADNFEVSITPGGAAVDFTTDITVGTLQRVGFNQAVPEIEVLRVELWDGAQTPALQLSVIDPADGEYINDSQAGWKLWGGILDIPRTVIINAAGNESTWLLKVWGYSPYAPLVDDADVNSMSSELEQALLIYCHVAGLRRLNASRELFTQWQTRSGNTDMSPAGLMNALNIAMEEWRHKANGIRVLREAPG
jgi:hypothetical protein